MEPQVLLEPTGPTGATSIIPGPTGPQGPSGPPGPPGISGSGLWDTYPALSFPNQVGVITTTNVGVGDTRAFTTLAVGSKGLVDGDAFYGVEVRQTNSISVPWIDQVIDSFDLSDLPDWRAIEYTIYFEASIGAFQTEKIIVMRNTNTNELTSSEYGILYNEFLNCGFYCCFL